MSTYEKFCQLRDFRAPGAEVPQHTEAEAFLLALAAKPEEALTVLPTTNTRSSMSTAIETAINATAPAVNTESAFVTVPETTLPNGTIVPAFQVGRYLCSEGPTGAIVDATLAPWVDISYTDARAACEAAGFKLITEHQALALAFNIASQPCNWIGGVAGVGKLHQGLRKYNSDSAEPGNFEPADPDEQRWFVLSSGTRICDVAGNAYTWVFDDVQGNEQGIVARTFAADSPSITTALAPSMEKGMGWQPKAGSDWSGNALVRGGCFGSGDRAGVFYLGVGWPGDARGSVGFRCTK